MSSAPLSVRIGDVHFTRQVAGLTFTKNAVGGVQSISLRLKRELSSFDVQLADLTKVTIFDSRSAEAVAQARIADKGRGVSAVGGQQWDIVALGPKQHASDRTIPYVVVDRSISDGWHEVDVVHPDATIGATTKPGDSSATPPQGILAQFGDGVAVNTDSRVVSRYDRLWEAGQKLARYSFTWDTGVTSATWLVEGGTRTDGGTGEVSASVAFNTAGGSLSRVVVTDFPQGRNTLEVRIRWTGGAATTLGDTTWGWFESFVIRALLMDALGVEITTGYTGGTVVAHQVVNDLLGRVLTQFDGATALVDTSAAYAIDQMAYPDGVTAEKVLDDLMTLEPAYRWTSSPDISGLWQLAGYRFAWQPWPTTIRYEATLADGGSFPSSSQELFNRVTVRWRDSVGNVKSTVRTMACAILDNAGVVRQALVDLADEVGSLTAAARFGDNFLADHNVPANAGTLNVARPIWDRIAGRFVLPHEIAPGELISVRGIESYADALNASSSDGLTVFRIWSMTYSSDSDSAQLELDTWSRTTVNALVALAKRRERKR